MRVLARLLLAVAVIIAVVVVGMGLVSLAQPGSDQSSLGGSNTTTTTPNVVTKDQFTAAANGVCLQMVSTIQADHQSFLQQVSSAGHPTPFNFYDQASTPLMGTITTIPNPPSGSGGSGSSPLSPQGGSQTGGSVSTGSGSPGGSSQPSASGAGIAASGSGSSSTGGAALSPSTSQAQSPVTEPSGSYDISPIQQNPLSVVNQLLNEYMDQLDGIVGMQNDVLDELETLTEPTLDEPMLQQMFVSMTQATIAQNQADLLLENIVSDYYTAGFLSTQSQLNGGSLSLGQAQQAQINAGALTQDLLELTGGVPGNGPAPGSLESNLQAITGPPNGVNIQLEAYGLNQCAIAGIQAQSFQTLAGIIPGIAQYYLNTYTSQAGGKSAISLAQILAALPQPAT